MKAQWEDCERNMLVNVKSLLKRKRGWSRCRRCLAIYSHKRAASRHLKVVREFTGK